MTIQITDSAANKFKSMTSDQNMFPRIEIVAGGCNGFEKRFSMSKPESDDVVMKLQNDTFIVLDEYSYEMLDKSVVDYKQSITGNFFSIEIPEAVSSCGCGSSFSL
jgi:iron-sulfur cluster insertion protein